ncbi:hypothetical protein BHM03_00022313 [Ensete ventricosum]|nr:hypothetical protein BHM03_00022313 [Ensete ventricosum]
METQRLWEEAEAATTYCWGSLSPALVGMIYYCPSKALMDLCSSHEHHHYMAMLTDRLWDVRALIGQLSKDNDTL